MASPNPDPGPVQAHENQDARESVMWREGAFRCELWRTTFASELRVYASDRLRYREPVLSSADVLQQAARLRAIAQIALLPG